jgi:hypothetical protein
MKYLFVAIVFIHGLIHLMGFAKAFSLGNIPQLTKEISKPVGSIWLLVCMLFIIAASLFLFKKDWWPVVACLGVAISMVLILTNWSAAKYGVIVNFVILVVSISSWASNRFGKSFEKDVITNLQRSNIIPEIILREDDIASLPLSVQKYIRYSGAINKPAIKNFRVVFDGEMRSKKMDWFKFQSVQYNFFDEPARLFFMKAKMFGTTVPVYHHYEKATATMQVKPFGLIPMVNAKGPEMNKAETVTVFNDMCLIAPGCLADKRIAWESLDSLTAMAIFTNGTIQISAILYFNEAGQLINFTSDDRYDINVRKQYRFSTPVKEYSNIDGRNVLQYAIAAWHYPEGEFDYGRFRLNKIEFNVAAFTP